MDNEKRIEELERILTEVMKYVDLWLKGSDFYEDEIGRAKLMEKRVVELLSEKSREIRDLKTRAERAEKMCDAAMFLVGKTFGE